LLLLTSIQRRKWKHPLLSFLSSRFHNIMKLPPTQLLWLLHGVSLFDFWTHCFCTKKQTHDIVCMEFIIRLGLKKLQELKKVTAKCFVTFLLRRIQHGSESSTNNYLCLGCSPLSVCSMLTFSLDFLELFSLRGLAGDNASDKSSPSASSSLSSKCRDFSLRKFNAISLSFNAWTLGTLSNAGVALFGIGGNSSCFSPVGMSSISLQNLPISEPKSES
jgi:hypothetical protein